jgi:diaminopimelate epimerase
MIPYDRYHGTGNDFAIVDATEYVPDRGAFAQTLCSRISVDGVLFLALEAAYTPPRAVMTLFQPDGSTASMCGNGARCAARWVAEETGADAVMLDTQAGTRRAEVAGATVTVEMGRPTFDPTAVPVVSEGPMVEETLAGYDATAVNTGVPHAVAFVDDVDVVDVEADAPAIRNHEAFPEGANATFASREGEDLFRQRTFERGVEGETQSCGTGAVAIAAVAHRAGLCGQRVRVRPPGGELDVDLAGGRSTLRGPTEWVADGEAEAVPARTLDA